MKTRPTYFYSLEGESDEIAKAFPDKLDNLNGYTYKVLLWEHLPRLLIKKGMIYSPEIRFMVTVAEKQKSRIQSIQLRGPPTNEDLNRFMNQVDVCINTGVPSTYARARLIRNVNTFDSDGYCALVPLPEKKSSFEFMFKPFDLWTWIFIILSMFGAGIVWHFLKKTLQMTSNSSGYFIYGFIASFFGQLIPFRDHRPMQKLILQLTIILTFILGTAYQSLVISSLADSRYGKKITTINELLNGNYSFHMTNTFEANLNGSDYFLKMRSRIIDKTVFTDFKMPASQNVVIVDTCSAIDFFLTTLLPNSTVGEAIEFYYKLDQKFNTFFLTFSTNEITFFHEKLNELSLRVLESGVRQHWNLKINYEDPQALKLRQYYENEEYLLNIYELAPAFYLLAFGLIFSFVTLFFEVFWHDFFQTVLSRLFCNCFESCKRKFYNAQRPTRHRIIQVQPAAPRAENQWF